MKEIVNQLKYSNKGELLSFNSTILETIKKEVTDEIDFTELMKDVSEFAKANIGKQIECQFIIKVVE